MGRFSARVHPRASRNAVSIVSDTALEVWTTAPPADGKANAAVERLVADRLGVPRSNVTIVGGAASRTKVLDVAGIDRLPTTGAD